MWLKDHLMKLLRESALSLDSLRFLDTSTMSNSSSWFLLPVELLFRLLLLLLFVSFSMISSSLSLVVWPERLTDERVSGPEEDFIFDNMMCVGSLSLFFCLQQY